jgi:hypothetical protein
MKIILFLVIFYIVCPLVGKLVAYVIYSRKEPMKNKYIHYTKRIGWFVFSFYKCGKKFSIRMSIEKGWE